MEPLTVVLWKWAAVGYRFEYTAEHVNVCADMVLRHYPGARVLCITDDPTGVECETMPLWDLYSDVANPSASSHLVPSCYRRLAVFSRPVAAALGPRIVSLDLDCVLCGDLRGLWDRDDDFVGWELPGMHHARVFNGSMWLARPSKLTWLWDEWDPDRSPAEAHGAGYRGSDQGWLSYRLIGRYPGWTDRDGVYGYKYHLVRRTRYHRELPEGARAVFFYGDPKPWDRSAQRATPWITEHWRRGCTGP